MTATIVIRQSHRVSVLTDGAALLPEGTVAGLGAKCFPLPHLGAALVVRGSQMVLSMIAGQATFEVHSFDHFREFLPVILQVLAPNGSGAGEAVEVIVAGWDDCGRAASFVVANHDHHAGIAPFVPVDMGDVAIMPGTPEIAAALTPHLPSPYTSVDQLDPERHGLLLMEGQRAALEAVPSQTGGKRLHIVGGFAQLTSVLRDRIETRVVHRWPDAIGAKINPN